MARASLALARQQGLRGKRLEGRAGHTADPPFGKDLCAEQLIEPDRRRIPIQYRPFEPPATALDRKPRKVDQEGTPVTAAAKGRPHKQILEIQAAAAKKGRE